MGTNNIKKGTNAQSLIDLIKNSWLTNCCMQNKWSSQIHSTCTWLVETVGRCAVWAPLIRTEVRWEMRTLNLPCQSLSFVCLRAPMQLSAASSAECLVDRQKKNGVWKLQVTCFSPALLVIVVKNGKDAQCKGAANKKHWKCGGFREKIAFYTLALTCQFAQITTHGSAFLLGRNGLGTQAPISLDHPDTRTAYRTPDHFTALNVNHATRTLNKHRLTHIKAVHIDSTFNAL